ncbi:helix-turn-helix domain-containing protein [Streptomyces sp. NPDC054952]
MPRQPSPISPDASPELRELAGAMRDLKDGAGLTFSALSERENYSTAALSGAVSGKKLPTWDVTRAFIRGCGAGAEEDAWKDRWLAAQEGERRRAETEAPGQDNTVRRQGGGVPRQRRSTVAELVREEVERRQQTTAWSPSEAMTVSTALALCTTAYDFRELLRDLMETQGLSSVEIRANARAKGIVLARGDVFGVLHSSEIPETAPLHGFLLGCNVGLVRINEWHRTATRIKISHARRNEPTGDENERRRFRTAWNEFWARLSFDGALSMISTILFLVLQLVSIAKHGF